MSAASGVGLPEQSQSQLAEDLASCSPEGRVRQSTGRTTCELDSGLQIHCLNSKGKKAKVHSAAEAHIFRLTDVKVSDLNFSNRFHLAKFAYSYTLEAQQEERYGSPASALREVK